MTVTIVDAARPVTGGADAHLEVNVAPGLVTGGVDTHLDLNVAAALDGIGGLLGGGGGPGPRGGDPGGAGGAGGGGGGGPGRGGGARGVRGGGGPGSCGRRGWRWSRWTGPTGRPAAGRASPIRWMPSRRPGRRCRGGLAGRPSPGTGTWRRSGRWWWPSGRRARPR